jgi:excinuclease ABC subunit C
LFSQLETGFTMAHGGARMSEDKPLEEKILPVDKIKQFPLAPGVYLMKDEQGRVLYVG